MKCPTHQLVFVALAVSFIVASTVSGQFDEAVPSEDASVTFVSMDTSFAVVGNASNVPMDKHSLDGLFTPTFRAHVKEKLVQEFDESTSYDLSPARIRVDSLQSDRDGQIRVAKLNVTFRNPPDEIVEELSVAAPKAALELLRESVHDYLRMQQDLQRENVHRQREGLKGRQQELEQLLREKQAKLLELRAGAIESSDTLRKHYLQLKQQQRDDRVTLLNTEARRDAIVDQIELLRRLAGEGPTDGTKLLDAMKKAAEERKAKLEELRQEAGEKNEAIKNLERAIAEKRDEIEATQRLSIGERDKKALRMQLEQQLTELKYNLTSTHAELADRVARAEHDAMQGRIEYLRQLEQQRKSEYGSRLEKLNEMLTDVAVASDEVEGRQEAIVQELADTETKIVDRMKSDLELERVERKIRYLENHLKLIEQQRMSLNFDQDAPPQQEFAILPWGG